MLSGDKLSRAAEADGVKEGSGRAGSEEARWSDAGTVNNVNL